MSDWLLDLGNTRLKLAPLAALDVARDVARDVASHPIAPADVQAIAHPDIAAFLASHPAIARGDRAWLASVASEPVTASLVLLLESQGIEVVRVRTQPQQGRLRIAYADADALGVDRFLALLAASGRDDGPWVLVSAGSALTADVLAADGQHLGGVIAPSASHARAALAERFPALDVPMGRAEALGTTTADAIAAGVAHAACGLVERVLHVARQQWGSEPLVLLSGGAAGLLTGVTAPRLEVAPALVLEGLAAYARARAN
ncbi:type III pantothenate kinase [soil metagenome]